MKPEKKNKIFSDFINAVMLIHGASQDNIVRNVNETMLFNHWQIGKMIMDSFNGNGTKRTVTEEVSKVLSEKLGRGYSRTNLYNMRLFHLRYPDFNTVPKNITWSHLCEILVIEDDHKRSLYAKEIENAKWSVRELKRQLETSLFERLLLSKGELNKKEVLKLAKEGQSIEKPEDILCEPYVLEFLGIPENKPLLFEKDLESRLIRYIENFLLELGKGFMYVGSQQRITIGNKHDYVDMVFYNKILRAYVLIDLKMQKLKPSYVGQMNSYLNYYKKEINEDIDNDPIGIILCSEKDKIVAEYALGGLTNQIFASRYTYYLPERKALIHQVKRAIEDFSNEEE